MSAVNLNEYKALVRHYFAAWSEENLDAIDEMLSPSYLDHDPVPGQEGGIAGVKDKIREMWQEFSALHFIFDDQIAEGEAGGVKVASRITIHATHLTGVAVRVRLMDIVIFADGKITEEWGLVDSLSLMQQMEA